MLALNINAPIFKQDVENALTLTGVNPLGWIGETVALYVDADPLWAEVPKSNDPQKAWDFFAKNAYRLPIGANLDVQSGLKLVAFLVGLRTVIDQTAPGMTVWETKQYKEKSYVKISPSAKAKSNSPFDKLAVYYAASGDALVVSISEAVLKLALDRQIARQEAKNTGKPNTRNGMPWLGENLCVTVDGNLYHLIQKFYTQGYHQQMQMQAWNNLEILNEWHHLYSDMDAVKVHEQLWHRRLICPGGGKFRWNEKWQTMESTVYGHPGEPKRGTSLPIALQSVSSGNFGLTFEGCGAVFVLAPPRKNYPSTPFALYKAV